MTRSRNKINIWTKRKQQALLALGIITTALFISYIYFLCASVMHVVVRMETERDIQSLQSDLNNLEAEFIVAQHTVSEKVASFDGFTRVKSKVFIDRRSPSLVLSQ